jgi:acyl phosphate:glycerol-3-phosphate acyltransferase
MKTFGRVVHLLALSLWFGSVTFFSFFTALPIIRQMESHAGDETYWLHLQDAKAGVRVAGDALEPVFARYFPLQVICGAAAIFTFKFWHSGSPRLSRVRLGLVAVAFLLACLNTFWLAPRLHELRTKRYNANEQIAQPAQQDFGTWHNCSLGADMAGLASLGVALALAGVPGREQATPPG